MTVDRDVQQRWSQMLQDADSRAQMGALTEIGRAFFRTEAQEGGGAVQVSGPAPTARELPVSLRDQILNKLEIDDPQLRAEALLALVHWHDEETVEAIEQGIKDSESTVRLAAIQTAATISEERLLQALMQVAESDEAEIVRAKAVDALKWNDQQRQRPQAAAGPVRTRSPSGSDLRKALDRIGNEDSSTYVRFIASSSV